MNGTIKSVALLFALLLIAPAMAFNPIAGAALAFLTLLFVGLPRVAWREFWQSDMGVQTINYLDPGSGTTAPTQQQASQVQAETFQVGLGDTEVLATVTHNWSMSAALLAKGFPFLAYYQTTLGAAGTGILTFLFAANTLAINKTVGTGSGGTWTFILQRPWSPLIS